MGIGFFIILGLIIAIVGTIVTLSLIVAGQRKRIKSQNEEIQTQARIIKDQEDNLLLLEDHKKAVKEITKQNSGLKQKIKEANDDKMVSSVISDIIIANNNRL